MCTYDFKTAGIFCIPKKSRDIGKELIEAHKNRDCSGKTISTQVFFLGFPVSLKQMLRRFPTFQVATTCFSCSPPDVNLVVQLKVLVYVLKTTATV